MKFAALVNFTAKGEISCMIKGTVASLYVLRVLPGKIARLMFKTTFKLCSQDVLMVDARFCRALQTKSKNLGRQIIYRAALPHASQAQYIEAPCLLCGKASNTTEHWITNCDISRASLFIGLHELGYTLADNLISTLKQALDFESNGSKMDKRLCAVALFWLATMRRYTMEEQCTWHPG